MTDLADTIGRHVGRYSVDMSVGDVHRTLCKQKQTSASCATNGERNTSNRVWTGLLQQIRLEHFEIISPVSIST